ncbi:hypothetical protein F5884DRAFT_502023 [Xylogone sp. PMI_703]|nr:hypothetical protein F5884DRAFT_502023 [Xylogone sp. PMI_703]
MFAASLNMAIHEYIISNGGDTILEFAKAASEGHPIMRFRVSSHFLLADTSSVFYYALSQLENPPASLANELPPPPSRHICEDGTEVNLYKMPQMEFNKNKSLTILLHAAHLRNAKVPEEISFQTFVDIAEVCLRYRLPSPLELQVEYEWLPQWLSEVSVDNPDGMVLISYAFGMRTIFGRVTKTVILNAVDDAEIDSKTSWPQAVREKIKDARAVKFAQVYECCMKAIEEYLGPRPIDTSQQSASFGGLTLTKVPRCPRGSSVCDATNLGWLILLYNELRLLPNIMMPGRGHDPLDTPRRSLKDLINCLRYLPSVPQGHSGICDSVFIFRSAINDISNSISGLTLYELRGLHGWPLSKHRARRDEEGMPDQIREIWSPLLQKRDSEKVALADERIALRVLSFVNTYNDLYSAAMINKIFYRVYKSHELQLLKRIISGGRFKIESRLSSSTIMGPTAEMEDSWTSSAASNTPLSNATSVLQDIESHIATLRLDSIGTDTRGDDSRLGRNTEEGPQPNRNEKFLFSEMFHIENKAIVLDEDKYLEAEHARAFNLAV